MTLERIVYIIVIVAATVFFVMLPRFFRPKCPHCSSRKSSAEGFPTNAFICNACGRRFWVTK